MSYNRFPMLCIAFLLIIPTLMMCGCSLSLISRYEEPVKTKPYTTDIRSDKTPTSAVTSVSTPSLTPNIQKSSTRPIVSGSLSIISPLYTGDNIYGPYIFGNVSCSVYISGGRIILFEPGTYKETVNIEASAPDDTQLFLLTASLIDYNFDELPDFSFVRDGSGRREVYLAYLTDDGGTAYRYDDDLSSMYYLSRCYEESTIYGKTEPDDEFFAKYQYLECLIGDGEPVPIDADYERSEGDMIETVLCFTEYVEEEFTWNPASISGALTGKQFPTREPVDILIRNNICHSLDISSYLTIAFDDYGNYYIKDMLGSGYCRLILNPDGHWSRGERVGN